MTDGARNMSDVIANVAKQNQMQQEAAKLENQLENQPKAPEMGLN